MEFKDHIASAWGDFMVDDAKLTALLKKHEKNKSLMHFWSSKFHMMPKGKSLPPLVVIDEKQGIKNARGKRVIYPKEMESYLERIIQLNKEGKTYAVIAEMKEIRDKKKELQEVIDKVLDTPRIMNIDPIENFHVAIKFLTAKGFLEDNAVQREAMAEWEKMRDIKARLYFFYATKMIGKDHSGPEHQDWKEKRDDAGRALDFYNTQIKSVTKQGVQLVREGLVSKEAWAEEVRVMKKGR